MSIFIFDEVTIKTKLDMHIYILFLNTKKGTTADIFRSRSLGKPKAQYD